MPLYEFEGNQPKIAESAFVAEDAVIIGDVTIEDGASVWSMAVLRADHAPIVVRAGANIQEGSVIHGPIPVEIGIDATVGHLCIVHGAIVGEQALIGNGSTVLDGARIGRRAMVGAGALVPPGMEVPDETLAIGVPAKIKGPIAGTPAEMWVTMNPAVYRDLAKRHKEGLRRLP
jgi:carbonic anhydrase/acetyltransferase-like protein (isoleucine patch superfamily)